MDRSSDIGNDLTNMEWNILCHRGSLFTADFNIKKFVAE